MKVFLPIIILSILFSCKKEENTTESPSLGFEYTPTTEGLEREYLVKEIDRFGNTIDTNAYYLKEVIGNGFLSGDGIVTELWRYKKSNLTDSYDSEPDSIWGFRVQSNYTILKENARERIEIGFPVYNNLTFDENSYNTSEVFNLFQKGGFTKGVTGGTYSNCVSTYRNDLSNLIETISREQYFAEGIGLIYSKKVNLSHQPGGDTIGSYYEKELISTQ